ncbi:MAG: hypothetical protein ACLFQB_05770 [Chitinispirillaceae bacterium]
MRVVFLFLFTLYLFTGCTDPASSGVGNTRHSILPDTSLMTGDSVTFGITDMEIGSAKHFIWSVGGSPDRDTTLKPEKTFSFFDEGSYSVTVALTDSMETVLFRDTCTVTVNLRNPFVVWQTRLGGSENDLAFSVQETDDGGCIVAAKTNSWDGDLDGPNIRKYGSEGAWIIKLDSLGEISWQTCLGGGAFKNAGSIDQDDWGYIYAGYERVNLSGDPLNIRVVKLDRSGQKIWEKSYGGSEFDCALSMKTTGDGGCIIAGYTLSKDGDVDRVDSTYTKNGWIIKLDQSGEMTGQVCVKGLGEATAQSVCQTADGGYVVSGTTVSGSGDEIIKVPNAWVAKLNQDLEAVWVKYFGGMSEESTKSVIQTSDDGFLIAGYSEDAIRSHGDSDAWLFKLDASGNVLWEKYFGGSDHDEANSVVECTGGGYIVAGRTASQDGDVSGNHEGEGVAWVFKIDPSGEIQWQKCLEGTDGAEGNSVREADGEIFISGWTWNSYSGPTGPTGDYDVWVARLSHYDG